MSQPAFGNVMVPVAFSVTHEEGSAIEIGPGTVAALRLARKLAAGGRIRLVHAARNVLNDGLYAGPEGTFLPSRNGEALQQGVVDDATKVLERLADRHCSGAKPVVDVRVGQPVEAILSAAEELQPDAIVLAASARGLLSRAFLGSTADKIIRRAPCPVVVVSNHAAEDVPQPQPIPVTA